MTEPINPDKLGNSNSHTQNLGESPNTTTSELGEILNDFRQSSIIIHAQGSVRGVEEDVRAFEASLETTKSELKAEILKIIGEDEKGYYPFVITKKQERQMVLESHRDDLRREQRTKLEQLFSQTKEEDIK